MAIAAFSRGNLLFFRGDKECGQSHIPAAHACHIGKGSTGINRAGKSDIAAEGLQREIFAKQNEYPKGKEYRYWKRYQEEALPLVKKHGKNWGIKLLERHLGFDDIEEAIADKDDASETLTAQRDLMKRGLSQINKDRLNKLMTPNALPEFKAEEDRILSIKDQKGTADKSLYGDMPSSKDILNKFLGDFEISGSSKASLYTEEFDDFVRKNPKNWGKRFLESQLEIGRSASGKLIKAGMSDLSEEDARALIQSRVKRSNKDALKQSLLFQSHVATPLR